MGAGARCATPRRSSLSAAVEASDLTIEPGLDEVRELAREHNPEFPAFLLESADRGQQVGRYSFIGVRPRKVVRWSLGDGGDPYALAEQEVQAFDQAAW